MNERDVCDLSVLYLLSQHKVGDGRFFHKVIRKGPRGESFINHKSALSRTRPHGAESRRSSQKPPVICQVKHTSASEHICVNVTCNVRTEQSATVNVHVVHSC